MPHFQFILLFLSSFFFLLKQADLLTEGYGRIWQHLQFIKRYLQKLEAELHNKRATGSLAMPKCSLYPGPIYFISQKMQVRRPWLLLSHLLWKVGAFWPPSRVSTRFCKEPPMKGTQASLAASRGEGRPLPRPASHRDPMRGSQRRGKRPDGSFSCSWKVRGAAGGATGEAAAHAEALAGSHQSSAARTCSRLRAPHPTYSLSFLRAPRTGPAAPATLRAPSPTEQPAANLPDEPAPPFRALRLWRVSGRPRLAVGREGHRRPPPGLQPLVSTPALLTGFSAELSPAPGVDQAVPRRRLLGMSGRRQFGESWWGRVEKSRGKQLSGFVYLGGGQSSWPLSSAVRAASAPAREWCGELARGSLDVPRVEGRSPGGGTRELGLSKSTSP